jgi:hypothetical protein
MREVNGETSAGAVFDAGTRFVPTHLLAIEWPWARLRRDAFRLTRTARFGSVATILLR